jgi:hypothetical protein
MTSSASARMAIGAGPRSATSAALGFFARATMIQLLTLPFADRMRRYALGCPATSVTPASPACWASSTNLASRPEPSAAPIRCGRVLSMITLPD